MEYWNDCEKKETEYRRQDTAQPVAAEAAPASRNSEPVAPTCHCEPGFIGRGNLLARHCEPVGWVE